jgi:hypothetical protein
MVTGWPEGINGGPGLVALASDHPVNPIAAAAQKGQHGARADPPPWQYVPFWPMLDIGSRSVIIRITLIIVYLLTDVNSGMVRASVYSLSNQPTERIYYE